MIEVHLTEWDMVMVEAIGQRMRNESIKLGLTDIHQGDRPESEKLRQQIEGTAAEAAFCKAANIFYSPKVNVGHREPDIDPDIEIRGASGHKYGLIVRPNDVLDRRFVLVTGTPPNFRVHGWLFGYEVRDLKHDFNPHGHRPARVAWQDELRPLWFD